MEGVEYGVKHTGANKSKTSSHSPSISWDQVTVQNMSSFLDFQQHASTLGLKFSYSLHYFVQDTGEKQLDIQNKYIYLNLHFVFPKNPEQKTYYLWKKTFSSPGR